MKPEQLQQLIEIQEKVDKISLRPNQVTFLDTISQEILRNYVLGIVSSTTPSIQTFTASGTYTVPSGTRYVIVEAVGGGGGGGGSNNSGGSSGEVAQSGGGGAYVRKLVDLQGVSSVTVTIGAGGAAGAEGVSGNGGDGGDTTFGSYVTAEGGNGDGSGGVASGGDVNIDGGPAGTSWFPAVIGSSTNVMALSGNGGGSFFGEGAPGAYAASGATVGKTASFYGGGGSGAASASGGADAAGGAGKGGLVIVRAI